MSISSLFAPNNYNIQAKSLHTQDIEPYADGFLGIGRGLVEPGQVKEIRIGRAAQGLDPETPVYIDDILVDPALLVQSIGPISLVPNSNGCIDTNGEFQLCVTDATHGGVLTAGAQTIGGVKTFNDGISLTNAAGFFGAAPALSQLVIVNAAGNLGTTGVVPAGALAVGPINATPVADGMDYTAGVLSLHEADSTHGGVISTSTQSIGGAKTFTASETNVSGVHIGSTSGNTIVGYSAINNTLTGIQNCMYGQNAGLATTTGQDNILLGFAAGLRLTTGNQNSCYGSISGAFITTGNNNLCEGYLCAGGLSTGSDNIIQGASAGSAYIGPESNNIVFKNTGIASESNAIHIGTQGSQTTCQIAGIYGNSPAAPQVVISDSNGNLGSATISSIAGVTTMAAIGAVPNANGASISGNTLTLQPASASFGGVITTATQVLKGLKQFPDGLQLGSTTAQLFNNAGSNLLYNGPFGDATSIYMGAVAGNAMTAGTKTNYIIGHQGLTLGTGNANVGLGYQVLDHLTSGTANLALGHQAGMNYTSTESSNICISNPGTVADSGVIRLGNSISHTSCYVQGISGITPGGSPQVVTIGTGGQLGSATIASIAGVTTMAAVGAAPNANGAVISGNTLTLEPADSTNPGVMTAIAQTFAGVKTFNNDIELNGTSILNSAAQIILSTGPFDDRSSIYVGIDKTIAINTGNRFNAIVGFNALPIATTSSHCTAIGDNALNVLLTGTGNVAVGASAGSAYTGAESNNICIKSAGVIADSGVIRIGTSATHTSCYVQGISGVTPGGSPQVVTIGTGGQLGSQTIASVSGVTTMAAVGVAPNANGAVISGNTLTLEPADGTHPGVMTEVAQTFGGAKTFNADINAQTNINMVVTPSASGASGVIQVSSARYMHTSGGVTNVYLGHNSANIGVSNTGANNNGIGQSVLQGITVGNSNNCLGSGAGSAITSGSFNTCIGQDAGSAISATSANSIMINNLGSGSDTAVTRIGTHATQTSCYVAGIAGVAANTAQCAVMTVDTTNSQLATLTYTANAAYTNSGMTCGATINNMTVRGGVVLTPFNYPITYSQLGNVIRIRCPAFQVTSVTGVPGTTIVLAAAGAVPAGLRPTLADCSMACPAQNGGVFSTGMYKIAITTGGAVNLIGSITFTTNFGLQEDTVITYNI
jgi:hypothetical protein